MKNFESLYAEVAAKKAAGDPNSGSVKALKEGRHFIGKKLTEEAAESWMAAEHEGKERAAEELSQLIYWSILMMHALEISPDDVYKHL